eukprot:g33759.t1
MAKVQKVGRDVPVTAWVERFEVVDAGSGQDVLSKGLDAVKARVSLAKTGQHVEYIIRVSFEGQSWQVTKRYNEFAALDEALKKKLASSAEVQEASFGIAHFDYDPVQGFLLMGSSDFSWASRVDTKITPCRHQPALNRASAQASSCVWHWKQQPLTAMFQDKYVGGNDCGWSRTARLAVLLVASGVVALTTWSLWQSDAQEEELLAKVLKELRRRLFHIARDVAAIAKD